MISLGTATQRAVRGLPLAALAIAASACGGPDPPRNVILVTIDTLRADRLGAYGSDKGLTPHLDALAKEATVFEDATTTTPLTGPAHSAVLTGRYPLVTGFRNNGTAVLSPAETLLPEVLHARGFRTGAVVSCLVLSSHFGFSQGFDLYYEDDITSKMGRGLWFEERKADKSVDRALKWVEADTTRPMFLWLHLFDPHHPYDPPGADIDTARELRYDQEVAFVDRELGRFFAELKRHDLWDDALVIVAADHGESLGDHMEAYHGIFVYQATMKIPLIVKLPGAPRGQRVADQASLLDIYPTVLDSLGILDKEIPEGSVQGVSLVPALLGRGRVPARSPYMESIHGSVSYGWAEVKALRAGRWKYIDLPSPELYDLEKDPAEADNLARTDPGRAQEVGRELAQARAALTAVQRTDVQNANIDDEMRERLLSLGYIAGNESKMRKGEPRDPKEVIEAAEAIALAERLHSVKRTEEAEYGMRQILKLDPENKLALTRYGRLLASTKRVDEGVATLRKAIEIYPDSEELYRSLGWILIQQGRLDDAIALFSQGLESLPASNQLLYMFGYARFRAERWEQALESLTEALRTNPGHPKARYLVAVCHEKLGQRDKAYADFETYLKIEPRVEELFRDPYLESFRKDPRFTGLVKRFL